MYARITPDQHVRVQQRRAELNLDPLAPIPTTDYFALPRDAKFGPTETSLNVGCQKFAEEFATAKNFNGDDMASLRLVLDWDGSRTITESFTIGCLGSIIYRNGSLPTTVFASPELKCPASIVQAMPPPPELPWESMRSSPSQEVAKSPAPPIRSIQKYDKVKILGNCIKSESLADCHHPRPPDTEGIVMEVNMNGTQSTAMIRVTQGPPSMGADPASSNSASRP